MKADCDCGVCAYSKKHPQLKAPRCWHVTADTITDEQIRRLRRELQRDNKGLDEPLMDGDIHTCTVALTDRRAMAFMMPGVAEGVRKAQARCADLWNARHAKDGES